MIEAQDLSGLRFMRVVLTRDIEIPSLEHPTTVITIKYGTAVLVDVSEGIAWDGGAHLFAVAPDDYCVTN